MIMSEERKLMLLEILKAKYPEKFTT